MSDSNHHQQIMEPIINKKMEPSLEKLLKCMEGYKLAGESQSAFSTAGVNRIYEYQQKKADKNISGVGPPILRIIHPVDLTRSLVLDVAVQLIMVLHLSEVKTFLHSTRNVGSLKGKAFYTCLQRW